MPESHSKGDESNGVVVPIPGTKAEIRASEGAVATIEHGYERSLQWAHENPAEFYVVSGLFAFTATLYTVRKVLEMRMKINFRKEQERSRQPELPFVRPSAQD